MNEEQKSRLYAQLLSEHTKLFNEISLLKSENMTQDPNISKKIVVLEQKQNQIMFKIRTLFN